MQSLKSIFVDRKLTTIPSIAKDSFALVTSFITVLTFLFAGLPGLIDAWFYNKPILGGSLLFKYNDDSGALNKYIIIANFGNQPAFLSEGVVCYYLDKSLARVIDPESKQPHPNFLVLGNTIVPAKSNQTISLLNAGGMDLGGLPVSEDNFDKTDLSYIECTVRYNDYTIETPVDSNFFNSKKVYISKLP